MPDSTIPTANTESNILQSQQRLPFLRRCSISDPRLDILPQNFSPEKGLNPFNRVLSGLFEGSTFSLSKFGSTDSVDKEGHQPKPASQEHLITTPKLATSSATDLKNSPANTEGGVLRKSVSALFGSSPQHHQHFPAIPETSEDQGGLTMSAKPTTSFTNANQSANTQSTEASSPQKTGGFMKMFGTGGFLSRPVLHSPEEQYRYIMALDR